MTAANHIGYFAHLIELGKMTEKEAMKQLKEMHEADMRQDEIDREFVALMRKQNDKLQRKLEESYNHIKPYLKDQIILKDMCEHCEKYCGKDHDYEECLNMPCFKCYLGYEYLAWETSWE